jgi:drug/metabolite transporter (DMT)-like permease
VRPWLFSLCIGALFFVAFYLQSIGLQHTTPSRSAFVTVMSVPMVPFLCALMHRRAPSPVHLIASLVATLGIGLVLAPGGELAPNRGDWLTLASAAVFAVEILLLEYVTRRAPVLLVAFGQIAGVALFSGLALTVVPLELPDSWPGLLVGVLVTGLFCTTLALGGMTWGQARVRAEVAAIIFALEPVFAALFVWLWVGQGLGPLQSLGGLVVFSAVAWSSRIPVEPRS